MNRQKGMTLIETAGRLARYPDCHGGQRRYLKLLGEQDQSKVSQSYMAKP